MNGTTELVLSERRRGFALAVLANLIWGTAAIYWMQTQPVSPVDVLAHRSIWTLPAVFLVLWFTGRTGTTWRLLVDWSVMRVMAVAAFLISINWGVFLYAVTSGRAADASLGYFLLPLLSVLLGAVFFNERPSPAQKIAVVFAIAAVIMQVVALGGLPLVSVGLSLSFALYGVIRKRVRADAIQGLFIEALFLMPFGLVWALLHDGAGLGHHGLRVDLFLIGAGAFTAVPLLSHVAAARVLPLSTVGLMSYVGPSIQLVIALTYLGEQISVFTMLAFVLVWCGLALMVLDNLRRRRQSSSKLKS